MTPVLLDPKEPHRFTPTGADVTYLLKVPTKMDGANYRREVLKEGGRYWRPVEILREMERGLREIYTQEEEAEQRDRLLAIVTEYRERVEAALHVYAEDKNWQAFTDATTEPAEITTIREHLVTLWPRVASMLADNEVGAEIQGYVAARMFLVGWERESGPEFSRGKQSVPDHVLRFVSRAHCISIGYEIARLIDPPPERLGNSGSESTGPSTPKTSPGLDTPPSTTPSTTTSSSSDGSDTQSSESTP